MHFGRLIKSLESIIDIIKKVQILMSLTTFIVFRNLFGVEKLYLLGMLKNLRSRESNDSKNYVYRPSNYNYSYPETNYMSLGLKPLPPTLGISKVFIGPSKCN